MSPDPGAMLRDWLNARDVRRWERRGRLPPTVERAYWTRYEYARDLQRLQRCGYHATSERVTTAYPDLTPNVTIVGPRRVRARELHSALLYRVGYERLSYATWSSVVPRHP